MSEVLILTVAYIWPLAVMTSVVAISDWRYNAKTRRPLVDTADPATEELLSHARARANRQRRTTPSAPTDPGVPVDVLREAWRGAGRVADPRRREGLRRRLEHRADHAA